MLTTDTELWRLLAEAIGEMRARRLDVMSFGGCGSYDEYRDSVGYLRALRDVEGAAQDIFGRMRGQLTEEEFE